MSRNQVQTLLDIVDQAFDHRSWHGTNLRGSLRGVSASEALWKPDEDRHSIWENVLHAAYWKYVIRRRLLGETRGSFDRKGSNWFTPEDATDAGWRRDVRLLVDTHKSMREAIAKLHDKDLPKVAPGSKETNGFLISGVAAHDLYHAGQIQLLKRLLRK